MSQHSYENIDAHQHFWRYTPEEYGWIDEPMSAIRRDFLPDDLLSELASSGIAGTVAVQARQTIEETRWLLDLADRNEFIRGVVGWAPIAQNQFSESLENLLAHKKLKGLRHVIQGESDDHYILREDFNGGIRALRGTGLVFDILILERQLPYAIKFVDQHPNQLFVLDHLAKPLIAAGIMEPWAMWLRELGRRENVFCKVSGMVTEGNWMQRPAGYADVALAPYLDVAVEAFTPQRLIAGSDWPVCLVGIDYGTWFRVLDGYFESFSRHERAAIFGGNASNIYQLEGEPTE